MKSWKKAFIALLSIVCLLVAAYFGFFLVRTVFPVTMEPPRLDTQELFEHEEVVEEPVEEEPEPEEVLPVEEPVEEEDPLEQKARVHLLQMTLEQKLWQMIFTTPDDLTGVPGATEAGELTRQALEQFPVGGLCYFGANLEDDDQIAAMLAGTMSFAETPLFLSVDEEGGLVSRLGANENVSVGDIGPAANFTNPDEVYTAACGLAGQLKNLGFNVDFAPVADLAGQGNPEIGTRAYAADPGTVAQLSASMVRGLQENGVAACLKHFPGHGSAQSDAHEERSVSTRTPEQLRAEEFVAFSGGIGEDVKFVMMSHLTNEALSPHPSSLSPETVSLLRKELGYDGLIITDSLKMRAIVDYYTSAQAAVMAIAAGCDMILMPNSVEVAYNGLVSAVLDGTLTQERIDESVMRILMTKLELGIME